MKKLIFVILVLLMPFSVVISQERPRYHQMLDELLIRYVEAQKKYHDELYERNKSKEKTSFSLSERGIALDGFPHNYKFPNELHETGIKFFYPTCGNPKANKFLKKPRTIVVLGGPMLEGNKLTLSLNHVTISYKKKVLNCLYGSLWFDCEWTLSCETGEWVLTNIKDGGI